VPTEIPSPYLFVGGDRLSIVLQITAGNEKGKERRKSEGDMERTGANFLTFFLSFRRLFPALLRLIHPHAEKGALSKQILAPTNNPSSARRRRLKKSFQPPAGEVRKGRHKVLEAVRRRQSLNENPLGHYL